MGQMRRDVFAWFDSCRQRGLRIYGQGITNDPALLFTFEYWDLWGSLWNELTGPDIPLPDRLANLRDPACRERLRTTAAEIRFTDSYEDTILHRTFAPEYQPFERMRVGDIAD